MLGSLGIHFFADRFSHTESRKLALIGMLILANCIFLLNITRATDSAWQFVSGQSITLALAAVVMSVADMVRRAR
ncbi:hypothetical protein ACFQ78_27235 [Streptomyces sp. NPDC056519]|uniref:hypothetical protein n=1 Tax=Streptomyces sp. NPDC056519 TaxID=3345849 RepID=UPI0036B50F11